MSKYVQQPARFTVLAALVLVLSAIACNQAGVSVAPEEGATTNDDASFSTWQEALRRGVPGVPFTVTITEAQIESQITQSIAGTEFADSLSAFDVTISENETVTLLFTFTQAFQGRDVALQGEVVFSVRLAGSTITVRTESATLGREGGASIDIPPELLERFNEQLAAALSGQEAAADFQGSITYQELTYNDGAVTISGTITR